jgi:hypothetical protein
VNDEPFLLFRELHGRSGIHARRLLCAAGPEGHPTWASTARVFSVEDPSDPPGDHPAAVAATVPVLGTRITELCAVAVPGPPEAGRHLLEALSDRCRSEGVRALVARLHDPALGRLLWRCGFRAPNRTDLTTRRVALGNGKTRAWTLDL